MEYFIQSRDFWVKYFNKALSANYLDALIDGLQLAMCGRAEVPIAHCGHEKVVTYVPELT